MNKTWLIFDCSYLCHRALHSMGELSFHGVKTGVIYGFFREVLDIQSRFDTPFLVFAFDSRVSMRKGLFPGYKAKRHKNDLTKEELIAYAEFHRQLVALRKEHLPAVGFSNVFHQSGYEADDIMASLVQRSFAEDDQIVIVASDHDLLQLLRGNVMLFNPHGNKRTTLQSFHRETDLVPKQWRRVLELAGCRTDNVPGIPGIGEKSAIDYLSGKLVKGSRYDKIKGTGKDSEIRQLSRKLTRLPFPNTRTFTLRYDVISNDGWKSVCKKLGMTSLISTPPRQVKLNQGPKAQVGFGLSQ